ncbi:MAG: IS5 family transposase [Elainellaceae cyanobacterium]
MCGGRKRGHNKQELGRSRGGFSSKLHVSTDGLGSPLRFILTSGAAHDIKSAQRLIEGLEAEHVLGDKAYDADVFVDLIEQQGAKAVIPSRRNRKQPRECDRHQYKERHLVECFFSRIKQFRRVFTRYDKLGQNYLSFVELSAILIWLK